MDVGAAPRDSTFGYRVPFRRTSRWPECMEKTVPFVARRLPLTLGFAILVHAAS